MLYRWLLEVLLQLRHARLPHEYIWRHIWQLTAASREDALQWYESSYGGRGGGAEFLANLGRHQYDTTAPGAVNHLVAAMQGFAVSPSERWFAYGLPRVTMEELPGVRPWLKGTEEQAYHDFGNSTFYDQLPSAMLDGITIGTATQRTMFDDDTERNIFETLHPLEVYIHQDWKHEIDMVFRVFRLNQRQALQFFPPERLSSQVMKARDINTEFQFLHAVFPRDERLDSYMGMQPYVKSSPLAMDAPWCSIYLELPDGWKGTGGGDAWGNRHDDWRDHSGNRQSGENRGKQILAWGGYRELPYIVWRWEVDGANPYGISPVRKMLPQITQANFYSKLTQESAYWAVNPAWAASTTIRDSLNLVPGGITYVPSDPNLMLEPLQNALKSYPFGLDREERNAMGIKQQLGTDVFTLFTDITKDGKTRTAAEIWETQGEKQAMLSSTNGRLNRDCFNPSHDIILWNGMKRGVIDPPPPALYQFFGTDLARFKVDYIGPLQQAQRRMYRVQPLVRGLEVLMSIAPFDPSVLEHANLSKMGERLLIGLGVDPDVMYTDAEVAEQRLQAAAAQRAQQQLDQLESLGRSVRGFGGMSELAAAGAGAAPGGVPTALPAPPARG